MNTHKNAVCPECGHQFQGTGFSGIDGHWRSKHEHIMHYEEAWHLISNKEYQKDQEMGDTYD